MGFVNSFETNNLVFQILTNQLEPIVVKIDKIGNLGRDLFLAQFSIPGRD